MSFTPPAPTAFVRADLSTLIPLKAGTNFTSPWLPVPEITSIRIGCYTDQAGELHTQHSDDQGITIIRDSNQPITANKAEFLSFHPRGSYFRVVMKNTAGADQTFLHLQTVSDTVAFPVTQSLVSASLGRTSLAIQSRDMIYDYKFDETQTITPFGREGLTVVRNQMLGDPIIGTVQDTNFWTNTLVGSGSASQATGDLVLATGATANSSAIIQSQDRGRFVPSFVHQSEQVIQLPDTGTANNIRRWGIFDANNGWFYEMNGTTFNLVGRFNGVDTRVANGTFNQIATFPVDTLPHLYDITFHGNQAYFSVDGMVYHVSFAQGQRGHLPLRYENVNSGGSTTNVSLTLRQLSYWRYGAETSTPRARNISGAATTTLKIGAGHLQSIVINNAQVTGTITIYDNTSGSGTKLATITLNGSGTSPPIAVTYGIDFNMGLTLVTTNSVGTQDVTAVFS